MIDLSFLSFGMLVAAFAGGAFGAAIGGQPAFIFTGFLVIAGEAGNLATEAVAAATNADPAQLSALGLTGSVAFGPVFGPHISFAAGAAASAYAAKRGYMDAEFDYHPAKNINYAFGTKPDVLLVGGLFGIAGYLMTQVMVAFAAPWDPVAMAVVLSAALHRVAFGYDLVGQSAEGRLNMRPFVEERFRDAPQAATDGGQPQSGPATRFLVEPWLPQQYKWLNVSLLGLVVGVLGAYLGYATGSVYLGFGISAVSLIFLSIGLEHFPVTHHITLPASTAVFAMAPEGAAVSSLPLAEVVLVGAGMGLVCALFGELFQRVFYAHGDTHFDPPAAAIVFGTFLVAVLGALGVFPHTSWVPPL
ncbi:MULTISPECIES: hypothetical protein [Haloferax]|uniref:DUF7973 domain-containing protein n=1 Tax=Haloferax massiliensis TaxID=1476858 RepID=A0A0D6JUP4_9EURY|nr:MULTISPECIES: hypothetical protein [Haloferax]MDS0243244.1 hypothetical protein [Haloferax sp. S2CR25]MDS0446365.1 hypothetical protein [Haloferax sp. S2CR25-2]CQR52463.1 hypothetical protein BN996_03150 [Haloferax massiliensis]